MPNKQFIKTEITKEKPEDKKVDLQTQDKILSTELPADKVAFGFDSNHPNRITFTTEKEKKKEEEIENLLYTDIKGALEDSSELFLHLEKMEMMYAGEPDPANDNDPWPGAANTRSPWAATSTKGKFVRWMASIFGIEPYCLIAPLPTEDIEVNSDKAIVDKKALEQKKEIARKIEKWVHFIFSRKMKGVTKYRSIFLNAGKLDVGIAKLSWERKYDKVFDINVRYTDIVKFIDDYPNYKRAGIKEEEYNRIIAIIKKTGSIVIPRIQQLKLRYNLPEIENVNRDKFILLPANAKNMEIARGYGYEMELTWNDLKKGEAEGRYSNIDRVKLAGGSADTNIVDKERNKQEKKKEPQTDDYKKKIYKPYKIIYNYDIDDDGFNEKLIFTYLYDENVLLKAEYWADNLFFIPHYVEIRPGRFDGIGVCKKVERINDQGDVIWNLRNNIARMVCSPSFKGKKGTDFDPTAQEFYPGCVFWLDNMDDVEQWVLINNFPELFNEEILLDKYQQQLTAISSGQMGRESPTDPNAPGNKTIALIQEGNILINDDISCLRDSVEEVYYRIIQMCAKYLPEDDEYLKKFGLTKQDLQVNLDEIYLNGISVSMNAESRKQEDLFFYSTFRQEPLIASDLSTVRKLLKSTFASWGRDKEALLPTELEVFEAQVKVEQEALRRYGEEITARKEAAERAGSQGIPPVESIPPAVIDQGGVK